MDVMTRGKHAAQVARQMRAEAETHREAARRARSIATGATGEVEHLRSRVETLQRQLAEARAEKDEVRRSARQEREDAWEAEREHMRDLLERFAALLPGDARWIAYPDDIALMSDIAPDRFKDWGRAARRNSKTAKRMKQATNTGMQTGWYEGQSKVWAKTSAGRFADAPLAERRATIDALWAARQRREERERQQW